MKGLEELKPVEINGKMYTPVGETPYMAEARDKIFTVTAFNYVDFNGQIPENTDDVAFLATGNYILMVKDDGYMTRRDIRRLAGFITGA